MNNCEDNSLPFFNDNKEKQEANRGGHFQERVMNYTNKIKSPHKLDLLESGVVYNVLSEPFKAQSNKIKNKNKIQFLATFRYYDSQNQLQLRAAFTLLLSLVAVLLLLVCLRQVHHQQKVLVESLEPLKNELPFRIYSLDDLSNIPEDCKIAQILNLEEHPKNNMQIHKNDTRFRGLISLEISAAVHVSWLSILTRTIFPSIEILKLNVDSLCLANTNTDQKSNVDSDSSEILTNSIGSSKDNGIIFQGIDALNLHTLSIHQFTQEPCKITSWIFTNGHFPKLKRLEMHHFHFTSGLFLDLLEFLKNPRHTISVVQITSSHLCTNCSLSQIQFIRPEIEIINKTEISPYVM